MMVKLVDHLVAGLHIDIDKRKEEAAKRQRLETQLCKLLAELIDTERKYVKDLEKVKLMMLDGVFDAHSAAHVIITCGAQNFLTAWLCSNMFDYTQTPWKDKKIFFHF